MSKYDSSRRSTGEDVKREGKEAAKEVVEAAQAAADVVTGDGTLETAAKEAGEALAAAAEAGEAAIDAVVDTAKEGLQKLTSYFRTKLGYQLHDPEQDVVIKTDAEGTQAELTPWLEQQMAAGLIEEVPGPQARAGGK